MKIIPQFQWTQDNFSFLELSRRHIHYQEIQGGRVAEISDEIGKAPEGRTPLSKNATMWSIILFGIGTVIISEH